MAAPTSQVNNSASSRVVGGGNLSWFIKTSKIFYSITECSTTKSHSFFCYIYPWCGNLLYRSMSKLGCIFLHITRYGTITSLLFDYQPYYFEGFQSPQDIQLPISASDSLINHKYNQFFCCFIVYHINYKSFIESVICIYFTTRII
jgi:hypothetical protein